MFARGNYPGRSRFPCGDVNLAAIVGDGQMTARRASRPSEAPPSSARFIPVAAALAALVATSYSQPLAVAEHEWLAFDGPASATVTFETRIPAQWDHVEGPQGRGALRVLVPTAPSADAQRGPLGPRWPLLTHRHNRVLFSPAEPGRPLSIASPSLDAPARPAGPPAWPRPHYPEPDT